MNARGPGHSRERRIPIPNMRAKAASRAPAFVPSLHARNKASISPVSSARPAGRREPFTFGTAAVAARYQ